MLSISVNRVVASVLLVTFTSTLVGPFSAVAAQGGDGVFTRGTGPSARPSAAKNNFYTTDVNLERRQHASVPQHLEPPLTKQDKYHQYLEIGGARYFNNYAKAAGLYDLFIPLLQTENQLFFTDARFFDRSGHAAEMNIHLGYRKLNAASERMFGIYGALDWRKSTVGNNFIQSTLGLEYWVNKFFVGGNVYLPLGERKKTVGEDVSISTRDMQVSFEDITITEQVEQRTIKRKYERIMPGVDAEIGHAITDNLTGYIGGYYFTAEQTATVAGPKVRLTYNYQKSTGRILGIIDGLSIEAGAQHDQVRGGSAYLGIRVKVGLTDLKKNSNLTGFERHMIELVRRDPDIIIGKIEADATKINKSYKVFETEKSTSSDRHEAASGIDSKDKEMSDSEDKNRRVRIRNLLLGALGLQENATDHDVIKQYRKFIVEHHPDKYRNKSVIEREEASKLYMNYRSLYKHLNKEFSSKHTRSQEQSWQLVKKNNSDIGSLPGGTDVDKGLVPIEKRPQFPLCDADKTVSVLGLTNLVTNVDSTKSELEENGLNNRYKSGEGNRLQLGEVPLNIGNFLWSGLKIPINLLCYVLDQVPNPLAWLPGAYAQSLPNTEGNRAIEIDPISILQDALHDNSAILQILDRLRNNTHVGSHTMSLLMQNLVPPSFVELQDLGAISDLSILCYLEDMLCDSKMKNKVVPVIVSTLIESLSAVDSFDEISEHINFLLNYGNHTLPDNLVLAILNVSKRGYVGSIMEVAYFEKWLEDPQLPQKQQQTVINFIANSLQTLIELSEEDTDLTQVATSTQKLLWLKKLPDGLLEAIFAYYGENQKFFIEIVLTSLAQNNKLPLAVLDKLLVTEEPLVNIADKKLALSIALKLAQNHILLPRRTLVYFSEFLIDDLLSYQVIDLYFCLRKKLSSEFIQEIGNGLIGILSRVSEIQREKIYAILDKQALSPEQQMYLELQQQWLNCLSLDDMNAKYAAMVGLYNRTLTTPLEMVFLKLVLNTQNVLFLQVGQDVFARNRESLWLSSDESEEKLLPLLDIVGYKDSWFYFMERYKYGAVHYYTGGGGEIIITQEQSAKIAQITEAIDWRVDKYFSQIAFLSLEELRKFLNFIKVTRLSEEDLKSAFDVEFYGSGSEVSLQQFYAGLLERLLEMVELPVIYSRKRAKDTVARLIKMPGAYPIDILFIFMNKCMAAKQPQIMVDVLELLSDYSNKLNSESFDLSGNTILSMLEHTAIEKILPALNKLRRDNGYYREWSVETFLDEFMLTNQHLPIEERKNRSSRFREVYSTHLAIREDWIQSRYKLEISAVKPQIREGYLYLYLLDNKVCLATTISEVCADDNSRELEKLHSFIENKPQDITCIYELAIKFNIVPQLRGIAKKLVDWCYPDKNGCGTDNQFRQWFQACRNEAIIKNKKFIVEHMAEILAVLSQAVYNSNGKKYYPRVGQLFSEFLLQFYNILQVGTGEGKTDVGAMYAIMANLLDTIDIFTSSSELAVRDASDTRKLYTQFGINVTHNIVVDGDSKAELESYKENIVYGDSGSFFADKLRDDSFRRKKERSRTFAFIDEVDNMYVDSDNVFVLLAFRAICPEHNLILGHLYFKLIDILQLVEIYTAKNVDDPNERRSGCYLKISAPATNAGDRIEDSLDYINRTLKNNTLNAYNYTWLGDNCLDSIEEILIQDAREAYDFEKLESERQINIPYHLKEFTDSRLHLYVRSLFEAMALRENFQYVVSNDTKEDFANIVIVDYASKGTLEYGMQWENGLHQILQIKHGLTMMPEGLVTTFIPNSEGYKSYQECKAATGSVGEEPHIRYFNNAYNASVAFVPPFIHKDLVQFSPTFTVSKKKWLDEIMYEVYKNMQRGSAVLVTFEYIAQAKIFRQKFKNSYPLAKIDVYIHGGHDEVATVKRLLQPGDIVLTTLIGSRGTNFMLTDEVKYNGGLVVIKTSFGTSIRADYQACSRAARNGEPGVCKFIINLQELRTHCYEKDECLSQGWCNGEITKSLYDCVVQENIEAEKKSLDFKTLVQVPYLQYSYELYNKYLELYREITSLTGYKLILARAPPGSRLEDLTATLYLENGKIHLITVHQKKNPAVNDISITSLVNIIDPQAEKNIKRVLANGNSGVSSFSYLEYEIIQFAFVILGYATDPQVLNYILHEYNQLLDREGTNAQKCGGGENGYLKWLLEYNKKYAELRQKNSSFVCNASSTDNPLLHKVKLRQLFSLWEKTSRLFVKESIVKQLDDNFGIWYASYRKYPSINPQLETEKIRQAMAEYRQNLTSAWDRFSDTTKQQYFNKTFIKNPCFYVYDANKALWLLKDGQFKADLEQNKLEINWNDLGVIYEVKASHDIAINPAQKRIVAEIYNFNNLLDESINSCTKAINISTPHTNAAIAWSAYYNRGVRNVVKVAQLTEFDQKKLVNQLITATIDDWEKARELLQGGIIPPYEYAMSEALTHKMPDSSPYVKKLQLVTTAYKKLVQSINNGLNIACQALSADRGKMEINTNLELRDMLREENVTAQEEKKNSFQDMWQSINNSKEGQSYMNNNIKKDNLPVHAKVIDEVVRDIEGEQGGYLFEFRVSYLREKDKGLWGSIAVFAAGVVQFAVGVWLASIPGINVFTISLSWALMSGGISDILQGSISLVTGNPIDFKRYLSSKSVSIAVSLAVAGTLSLIQKLAERYKDIKFLQDWSEKIKDYTEKLKLDTKEPGWQKIAFAKRALDQTRKMVIVKAVSAAGNKIFVHKDNIEGDAKSIFTEVVMQNRDILDRVYMNPVLKKQLFSGVDHLISQNSKWRFNTGVQTGIDYGAQVADSLTGGYGSIAAGGVRAMNAGVSSSQILDEAAVQFDGLIQGIGSNALSGGAIFEREFTMATHGDAGQGLAQDFGHNNIFIQRDYNCTQLLYESLKPVSKYIIYKDKGLLEGVCKNLQAEWNKNGNFTGLVNRLVDGFAQLKVAIQEDLVQEGANIVAPLIDESIVDRLNKFAQNANAKRGPPNAEGIPNQKKTSSPKPKKPPAKKRNTKPAQKGSGSSNNKNPPQNPSQDTDWPKEYESLSSESKATVDSSKKLIEQGRQYLLDGNLEAGAQKVEQFIDKYNKLKEENPKTAEMLLGLGMPVIKGIVGGVSGFTAGVIGEGIGQGVNFLFGKQINVLVNKAVDKYSPYLLNLDPKLTPQHAALLTVIMATSLLSGRQVMRFTKALRVMDFSRAKVVDGKLAGVRYFKEKPPQQFSQGRSGWQEHHIIPKMKRFSEHPLVKRSGLDINNELNKMHLPSRRDLDPIKTLHRGNPDNAALKRLERVLNDVGYIANKESWSQQRSLEEVKKIIAKEREGLNAGNFHLNKAK